MKALFGLLLAVITLAQDQEQMEAPEVLEEFPDYSGRLDKERFQVDQPVIGIMTMPFWDESMKTETFQYEHFTWEHNVNFVRYAGSFSLPIKYNLPDEELYELLDQINGAYFTGGGLNDLVHTEYYQTAKKIWNYSKKQKDEKGITWPIFGICQGFEVLNLLANEDREDTLTEVVIYGESRPLKWIVDPKQTRLFNGFPQRILDQMATEDVQLHAHTYTIATDTYEKTSLKDMYRVLATDEKDGIEFVVAMEAWRYPIAGTMHHPETQNIRVMGGTDEALQGKVNNAVTDEINYHFSYYLHEMAQRNLDTHKFQDKEDGCARTFRYQPIGLTNMYSSLVLTYGIE